MGEQDERFEARAPVGTHDVLWPESARWEALIARFAGVVERAGFGLAHTPIFEDARLFHRGIGESTDVVGKEMYELEDRGGRRLALRPEGTASVVRAFVQHHPPTPWRAWYVTPAFRYERPQAGRYRQHHQLGVEVLGTEDPDLDAEVLALAQGFVASLGLTGTTLHLGSMGDGTCRPPYVARLRELLAQRHDRLCPEHQERYAVNPLRVLDCKKPECQAATAGLPLLAEQLCQDCQAHLDRVRAGMDALGVPHVFDPRVVRGLDYYTRTTFEIVRGRADSEAVARAARRQERGEARADSEAVARAARRQERGEARADSEAVARAARRQERGEGALGGAQDVVSGGGRYDGLVEALGGPPTPGIGFGMGIERLLLACDAEGVLPVPEPSADAFVVDVVGGAAARDLTAALRARGLRALRTYDQRSMKAQLKAADRSGARVAVIVGAQEEQAGTVTVRDLRDHAGGGGTGGAQRSVPREQAVTAVEEIVSGRSGGAA